MLIDLKRHFTRFNIKNEKVVVQFSASWCGNCRIMKPKLKDFRKRCDYFVLVDAENSPESRKIS
jgi:thiol-disulfide isomerase/thioredoxin